MATTNLPLDQLPSTPLRAATVLFSLPPLDSEALKLTLTHIADALPQQDVLVATCDASATSPSSNLRVIQSNPTAPANASWTLTAADFLNAHELLQQHNAGAIVLLGAEAQQLTPDTLRALAEALIQRNADLAIPRYTLPPRAGLVNSAILYPVTRALFGASARFPLALDLGLSARAAERLATAAQRYTAANQPDAILWPVPEAAVPGFSIQEVEGGSRTFPQPLGHDLNSILAQVAGSLFADIDAKAAFWQRARVAQPSPLGRLPSPAVESASSDDVPPMIDSFRLAFGNLQEIWSLVLPPQSLFGLKRLAAQPANSFSLPDNLWARIVYDFVLAFRLRTINRGHLLGAMTPLYLAWVASHLIRISSGNDPEQHVESVARAFEADKPYLVSRWRWPDRFNP